MLICKVQIIYFLLQFQNYSPRSSLRQVVAALVGLSPQLVLLKVNTFAKPPSSYRSRSKTSLIALLRTVIKAVMVELKNVAFSMYVIMAALTRKLPIHIVLNRMPNVYSMHRQLQRRVRVL